MILCFIIIVNNINTIFNRLNKSRLWHQLPKTFFAITVNQVTKRINSANQKICLFVKTAPIKVSLKKIVKAYYCLSALLFLLDTIFNTYQ